MSKFVMWPLFYLHTPEAPSFTNILVWHIACSAHGPIIGDYLFQKYVCKLGPIVDHNFL